MEARWRALSAAWRGTSLSRTWRYYLAGMDGPPTLPEGVKWRQGLRLAGCHQHQNRPQFVCVVCKQAATDACRRRAPLHPLEGDGGVIQKIRGWLKSPDQASMLESGTGQILPAPSQPRLETQKGRTSARPLFAAADESLPGGMTILPHPEAADLLPVDAHIIGSRKGKPDPLSVNPVNGHFHIITDHHGLTFPSAQAQHHPFSLSIGHEYATGPSSGTEYAGNRGPGNKGAAPVSRARQKLPASDRKLNGLTRISENSYKPESSIQRRSSVAATGPGSPGAAPCEAQGHERSADQAVNPIDNDCTYV